MRIELDVKMFIGSAEQSNSEDADENGASTSGKEEVSSIKVHGNDGILNMQSVNPALPVVNAVDSAISGNSASGLVDVINSAQTADDVQNLALNNTESVVQTTGTPFVVNTAKSDYAACTFKLEKPKLPIFSGNVRDYAIFRSDIKHMIEANY